MKTKTNNLIKPIQLISFDTNKSIQIHNDRSEIIIIGFISYQFDGSI